MAMASPIWSPWPCDTRMNVGATSSALTAAAGLPVRNGSINTLCASLSKSKQACPSQHKRVAMTHLRRERDDCLYPAAYPAGLPLSTFHIAIENGTLPHGRTDSSSP